jgi:putative tricarboxylic transport membrane protein
MLERSVLAVLLAISGLYLWGATEIQVPMISDPVGPRVFPMMIAVALVIACTVLFFETQVFRRRVPANEVSDVPQRSHELVAVAVMVLTGLYFGLFEILGYAIATSLYLAILTLYLRRGHTMSNVLTAVLFSFVTYGVFTRLLAVRLPSGVLPF